MIWHKLKQLWQSLNSDSPSEKSETHKKEDLEGKFYDQCRDFFAEDSPQPRVKPQVTKPSQSQITITPFEPNVEPKLEQNYQTTSEHQVREIEAQPPIIKPLPPRQTQILPPQLKTTKKAPQKPIFQDLSPPRSPQLPQFYPQIKLNQKINTERFKQVIWKDCDDVYRPIDKPIAQFLQESNILAQIAPVYIEKKAYLNIINHLKSDLEREQGGILFGNAYRDPQKGIYVKIVSAIAAPNTLATKAHLEFTAQTWQGIMEYAKEIYLSENIVGWYHSHPNIGVFMSNTDLKTQEAFFYHPWSLSIVYDPVRHEIGYFLGKKAQPIRPVICNSTILN